MGEFSQSDFTNAHILGAIFFNGSIRFDQLASTWDYKQRRLRVTLTSVGGRGTEPSEKWDFSHFNLRGSCLWLRPTDVDFTDATIEDCTLRNGITEAQLYSTRSYRTGNLSGLCLANSDLSGCDLSGMNLSNCHLGHCKFAGADFEDAIITNASFEKGEAIAESDQLTVEQVKSTWNYKQGRMEGIRLPEELAEALKREQAAITNE
jgi:uncharacterized protein YjbI with pentapeptide repeats